jgi:hypothetical protein
MSAGEAVEIVASCDCGERYDHDRWCTLLQRGVVVTEAPKIRIDSRDCQCGVLLGRALVGDTSVCASCGRWTGPRKTWTWFGVLCERCATHEVMQGGLRCVQDRW